MIIGLGISLTPQVTLSCVIFKIKGLAIFKLIYVLTKSSSHHCESNMYVNFNWNHASREMFPRGSVNKVIEVNEQVVVAVLVFAPIKLFIFPG